MSKGLRRYEFSERLADIIGASRRDLRFRVTLMVTAGLIPPGPRGPGSPPATPGYAADLLIGAMSAPQQSHTVEAIQCYRALRPSASVAIDNSPRVIIGPPRSPFADIHAPDLLFLADRLRFGEALSRLLACALDSETHDALARTLFGVWISRGFPVASLQFVAGSDGSQTIVTQRYELPEGARPPAWLDPDRGGSADPGLFHTVFLPVNKVIEIGQLTTSEDERTPRMLDLGPTITNIANLVRDGRHRRRWESFLSNARAARAAAEKLDTRSSRYTEVAEFGSNPGNLRMLTYVPNSIQETAPLVVVLHGCTQTAASYDHGAGWSTLADRHGFALLLPEQRRSNNPLRCFNWFRSEDFGRDDGEPLSIRQMVDHMISEHGIDRTRVYVTGLSAGGAMTSVMLATYPDVFAGGAVVAGVPFQCANGLQEAFETIFQGQSRSAGEWGDLVRAASSHQGPWPKVSVWHGEADSTVKPTNAEEVLKQWTNVHSLGALPTIETTTDGCSRRIWRNADGKDVVEAYTVPGMSHGQAVKAGGPFPCGNAAPFFHDVGIASTDHIARFWGLTDVMAETQAKPRPTASPSIHAEVDDKPRQRSEDAAPDIVSEIRITSGIDDDNQTAADTNQNSNQVSPPVVARDDAAPSDRTPSPTLDLLAIVAKSLSTNMAGSVELGSGGATDSERAFGGGGGTFGIDIQDILSKSFEAAGLLKSGGNRRPRSRAGSGAPLGIDIPGILSTSFEVAGLINRDLDRDRDSGPRSSTVGGSVETGGSETGKGEKRHDGTGWQLLAGEQGTLGDGSQLFGDVRSGTDGEIGNKVRSFTCQVTLGDQPRLGYERRLNLNAAANPFTRASLSVLVDGVVVDEVSAIGMDYAETEWTAQSDIDLSRFGSRTATLTFELAANSNVFVEVSAKAWLRRIKIHDATTPAAH